MTDEDLSVPLSPSDPGNFHGPDLVQHGPAESEAEARIHVTSEEIIFFWIDDIPGFDTGTGKVNYDHRAVFETGASQGGATTSSGFMVQLEHLPHKSWEIPQEIWSEHGYEKTDREGKKGKKAEEIAAKMLRMAGHEVERVQDQEKQLAGVDLIAGESNTPIQVKADRIASRTGRAYIETQERNPKSQTA